MNFTGRLFERLGAGRRTPAQAAAPPPADFAPRASPLPAGTVLGGARIVKPLAWGAHGALYGAVDDASEMPLAVKVLLLAGGATDSQAADDANTRFLQEGERASRLIHPDIVRVYGGGITQGIAFIVMELLPGADLSRYTRVTRLLPEALALEIAARLADALAYAHRSGVVHRDVKPANVMFDPASNTLKLTDFGLARVPDAEATRSGVLLGSPAYMAPELLAGARADGASDLYALGVLLFELLTGHQPHEATSMGALLRSIATESPQAVHALRPDLAPQQAAALDDVLALVLERLPGARIGDGTEWAFALRELGARWAGLQR